MVKVEEEKHMDAAVLGPIMIGAVIGWIIYYFMRQFTLFSPATLASTIAAFLGGPVLKYLNPDAFGGSIQSLYFAGVGIGFYGYAGYLGILLVLQARGTIEKEDFNFFAGCGGEPREHKEFREIMGAVRKYKKGEIDENRLKSKVRRARLTRHQRNPSSTNWRSRWK